MSVVHTALNTTRCRELFDIYWYFIPSNTFAELSDFYSPFAKIPVDNSKEHTIFRSSFDENNLLIPIDNLVRSK